MDATVGHAPSVAPTWSRLWVVATLLAVIALVLLAAWALRSNGPGDRRSEVIKRSRVFAVALSSYDYRHLDADIGRVRDMGVGRFRYAYQSVLGGQAFVDALRSNQAVATARVLRGPFVTDVDSHQARTYTVLEQRVSGRSTSGSPTRQVLVETTLVHTENGWKIDWVVLS